MTEQRAESTDAYRQCPHEGTGTAGVICCRFCGAVMSDNGVRIAMTVHSARRVPPSAPDDPRFCYCGAGRGHYGWERCKPKERLP